MQITSAPVTIKPLKLRAIWSVEPSEQLMAIHGMSKTKWWQNSTDVTQEDVINLIVLYNSFVTHHGGDVKYYIKYKSKNFAAHKHYGDAFNLIRFMNKLEIKPREYFNVQFEYYKKEKKHPYCRPYPSLKNLFSPAALTRWKQWLIDTKKEKMPAADLTPAEIRSYEESYLKDMMKAWNFTSEKEFFKDIVLTRHFSLDFLHSRGTFMELVDDHFYERSYSVKDYRELFV